MYKWVIFVLMLVVTFITIAKPVAEKSITTDKGVILYLYRCDSQYMVVVNLNKNTHTARANKLQTDVEFRKKIYKLEKQVYDNKGITLHLNLDKILDMDLCSV